MAENKTPPPAPKGPSLSDTNARDSFIAVALGQIVAWQMAEGKINHDQAGTYAVRYANSAMKVRSTETAPLNLTVAKGTVLTAAPQAALPEAIATETPSIEELIKDEPVAEVK